jgi:hypothetical protein
VSFSFDESDREAYRKRLHEMTDLELSDPKKNFGTPNPAFKIQLDEARAEWRRRHPKLPTDNGGLQQS